MPNPPSPDRSPLPTSVADLQFALQCHRAGRLTEAAEIYQQILRKNPADLEALHKLGLLLAQLGRNDLAADFLGQAIALSPRLAVLHSALAEVSRRLNNLVDAEASARRAVALDPNLVDAHYNLGVILAQQRRSADAIVCYQRALALTPRDPAILFNLGNALREARRPDEALSAYRQAIALKPDYTAALGNLANTLEESGRTDEAIPAYQAAIALHPQRPEPYQNLGMALFKVGRKDEAAALFARALDFGPLTPEARFHIAAVTGQDTPPTAPPAQVVAVFDNLAAGFDHHLVGQLHYRGPELLYNALLAAARGIRSPADQTGGGRGIGVPPIKEGENRGISFPAEPRGPGPAEPAPAAAPFSVLSTPPAARGIGFPADQTSGGARGIGFPADQTRGGARGIGLPADQTRGGARGIGLPPGQTRGEPADQTLPAAPAYFGDILDLGCGTGLCAPLLKPHARTLTGVDLSPAMIEKARERGLYDELAVADLTAALLERPDAFDLALAADVFIYIGDLDPVFAAAFAALRPNGLFAFTVEALDPGTPDGNPVLRAPGTPDGNPVPTAPAKAPSFLLRPTRRYAHSAAYIFDRAAAHGFQRVSLARAAIRLEDLKEVPGLILVFRKPDRA